MKQFTRNNKTWLLLLLALFCVGGLWLTLDYGQALAVEGEEAAADEEEHDIDYYRDQQQQKEDELEQTKTNISQMRGKINDLELKVYELEAELVSLQEQIAISEEAVARAAELVAQYQQELADAEARMIERQKLLMERITSLYIYGEIDMLDVAFGADSFQDFLTVYDMTDLIMAQDQDLITQIRGEIDNIAYYKSMAEQSLADEQAMQAQLLSQQNALTATKVEYYAALNAAESSMEQLKAYEDELEQAAEDLTDKIRELLAAQQNNLDFGGELMWPLSAAWTYVSSEYGYRIHPIYGDWRFHSGIDIPANAGANIYAAADGKIILKEWLGGYGNCVMIDHGDGVVTLYGHMSGFADPNVGSIVVKGDTIGYVGTTGASTGNHLHFEVRVNGEYTDPWNYLK